MSCREWVTERKDLIETVAAIVSAMGIVIAVAALGVSIFTATLANKALQHETRVTKAQTHLHLQQFVRESEEELFLYSDLQKYIKEGADPFEPGVPLEKVMLQFGMALHTYYVFFRQHELGTTDDAEWEITHQQMCRLVSSKGGGYYFWFHPLENTLVHDSFKKEVRHCGVPALHPWGYP